MNYFLDLPKLTTLSIGSNSFGNSSTFHLSNLNSFQSLNIGNGCFGYAALFEFNGFQSLRTISIGSNSFTQVKQSNWEYTKANNQLKSFHILNCELLESIQIGEYSFSDYAGEFELKNLPQLQSIEIGTSRINSGNFFYSSFVIQGIYMILNVVMNRSNKPTIYYIR